MSIVIAILILGFIIFIHELGHFSVAKFFKVPIREFSIGMGPRILSKVVKNTRYSLKAFPFGGSCAMIGEDAAGSGDFSFDGGEVKDDGTINFEGVVYTLTDIEKNNFSSISPWKKFLICLAGPFANFILAFICAFILVANAGFDTPAIIEVPEEGAASIAKPYKIEAGDIIVRIKIPGEDDKINSYRDLSLFMQLNNDEIVKYKYPLLLTLDRKGEILQTVVYPKITEDNKAVIGVLFSTRYTKPSGFLDICKYAFKEFAFYINTTIKSLRMLVRGKLTTKEISGPVGTVAVMGDAISEAKNVNVSSAILTILMLTVLISANLGVMNLLPIPALDGGRIVFAAIEMIVGKKHYSKSFETIANTITMILLLIFMMWIFGMDIYKLIMGM